MSSLQRSKSRSGSQKKQAQYPADDTALTSSHTSTFPIFQTPTADSLDGSLASGRIPYTPSRQETCSTEMDRTPLAKNSGSKPLTSVNSPIASTPPRVPQRQRQQQQQQQQPTHPGTPGGPPQGKQRLELKRQLRRKKGPPREFQISEDIARVEVRTINVAERSAFAPIRPPSIDEWIQAARQTEQTKRNSVRKHLSPSLQHLKLLHKMQIRTFRQLSFSPGLSLDADPWNEELEGGQTINRRISQTNRSDGKYRPIHPLNATMAVLPKTPPTLSHRKYRLPAASDVGFPNPLPGEIERKQNEIRLETQWEEASPRLIVLITSDDMGTAVFDDMTEQIPDLLSWNQGGWDGLPFAGRELIMAKERNYDVFGKTPPIPRRTWKANPTSMLAPPLDSNYSSAHDWKPRPFHDRPPGFIYVLACPTTIEFTVGNIEPLICCMALYTLPPDGIKRKGHTYGKASEDFYLPAGDWEGKIDLESARKSDGGFDRAVIDSWHRRKHKGIFSYDPKRMEIQSLYLVIQIFQLSQRNSPRLYIHEASKEIPSRSHESTKKKSISHRIKSKLGKISKSSFVEKSDSSALDSFMPRSESTHEKYGTKLLTPLCFGVVPLFSSASAGHPHWPEGCLQETRLYQFPTNAESEDDFVDRLIQVAVASFSDVNEGDEEPAGFMSRTIETESTKRGRFNSSRTVKAIPPTVTRKTEEESKKNTKLAGSARIFTSNLGVDFTQAMLSEPTALTGTDDANKRSVTRRLLVDVSGDCAIAMNPPDHLSSSSGVGSESSRNKRSSLIRLPQATTPAGYADIADVRELLYLPPRSKKKFDADLPTSLQSTSNLLYIYPRVLTLSRDNKGPMVNIAHVIRIRLVMSAAHIEPSSGMESSQQILESFHNSTPWAGPRMLNEVYTKLLPGKQDIAANGILNIALRDEFKLRLPFILDGTYFLEFRLLRFNAGTNDINNDLEVGDASKATIPLSSSSNREASSGVKVTTAIPNGSHRLKLGEHLLQFETRLVSSIHVGDPTTATTLRDFPYSEDSEEEFDMPDKFKELSLAPSRSIVGKLPSAEPIVDIKVPFHHIFAHASESTLLGQFPLLFHMHLSNLTKRFRCDFSRSEFRHREGDDISVMTGMKHDGRFIVDNICSLLEIVRKVKQAIAKTEGSTGDPVGYFCKEFVDRFDEGLLLRDSQSVAQGVKSPLDDSKNLPLGRSRSTQSNHDKPIMWHEGDVEGDMGDHFKDGGAVRLRAKDSMRTDIDQRISKTISAVSTTATPFSRVAYGATKTDRMRIEAELQQEGSKFTHLIDDDETIMSSVYTIKEHLLGGNLDISRIEHSNTWGVGDDETVIDASSLKGVHSISDKGLSTGGFGEFSIAKRVRTAAQVMISPCIAPSLSTTLANGSRRDGGEQPLLRKVARSEQSRIDTCTKSIAWIQPGSDSEEEILLKSTCISGSEGIFREGSKYQLVALTLGGYDEIEDNPNATRRLFAYEAIFMLWAKSWLDSSADSGARVETSNRSGQEVEDSLQLVASFYAHKDLLLPLCLKSMTLRCSFADFDSPQSTHVILDEYHMQILEPVIEMLCKCLMVEALSIGVDNPDQALASALRSVDTLVDFLIGLSSIIHPQQQEILFTTFFRTLRASEKRDEAPNAVDFEWSPDILRRVKSSRHLRLRAIEKLSVIASFLQSNFPLKYATWNPPDKETRVSWNSQRAGGPDPPMGISSRENPYNGGNERLPRGGWLAGLLIDEAFLICSLSCEAVVAEAMALAEVTQHNSGGSQTSRQSALQQRPGKLLKHRDLLLLQSMSVHSVMCVHELLLRRHAMDSRYQFGQCQMRIAATFAPSILTNSIDSVRWLARMETTHKVRSVWLLCFIYILQEAPEALLRARLRFYCFPPDFSIHRFIRLLRLCTSTFQCLVGDTDNTFETDAGSPCMLSAWLLQESFNTICASATLLVDECTTLISSYPREQTKLAQGILDLLLHILTIPQSAVTHLRSVGAALHSLTKFGPSAFFDVVGDSLQHWIRVILTLMNSISLSVRSISVDFVVSLLGETFKVNGNIDEISTMIATVLPEVIAREIALYSVSGLITAIDQLEYAVWPLRRAFADVEEANPLDDSRVDPQLSPILSVLCRTCQAIMDGVLIELRLHGANLVVVGIQLDSTRKSSSYIFDADEESLYEAASFFPSETAALQKLRWLQTLKSLHVSKGQWIEAADTLMLCAKTISDSIPHLRNGWRPSEFDLWHDDRRSLWLGTIGKNIGLPDRGNAQVMEFAAAFLEPPNLFGESSKKSVTRKLAQPTVSAMCRMLTNVSKEAVSMFLREDGMDQLAFTRLEDLLRVVMCVVEDHSSLSTDRSILMGMAIRHRLAEETALLRRVSASLNADLTRLAERLALLTEEDIDHPTSGSPRNEGHGVPTTATCRQYYVRMVFSGVKPERFTTRTTIPTFFEWENPCIYRVSKSIVANAISSLKTNGDLDLNICSAFAQPFLHVLGDSVVFRNPTLPSDQQERVGSTFLDISLVYMDFASLDMEGAQVKVLESKHFFYRKSNLPFQLSNGCGLPQLLNGVSTNLVEFTVVRAFPCPLSRQRTLLTSEFMV